MSESDAAPPAGAKPQSDAAWALKTARDIWDRLAARDYAGWDPYDALNARCLPSAVKNARFLRRALTQAVKRSPVPLQPLLGVDRQADAYTLGHVLLAAARLSAGQGPAPGDAAPTRDDLAPACGRIVARLRSMAHVQAHADGDRLGWGYHFPVHTRFFSYVPPTPNLIVTAFVAKGLAAVTRAGLVDCTAEIRGAAAFILGELPRVTDETGQCIGYVPGDTTIVHNANMLAAMVLCEAAASAGTAAWIDEALTCARFTVARQAADGSWPYSEETYGRWVDGFHTGFALEGLASVVRSTGDDRLRAALDRGVRYYVAQLFGPDGEPKYYPNHARPFDALSAAQGVETLHVALGDHAAQAVPGQIGWIRGHLVRSGGRVAYQVHRGWTDRREFPRWSSAPLMSALAGVANAGGAPPAAAAAAAEARAGAL
jgi:polysaccharide biosynthesis protein VpsJ